MNPATLVAGHSSSSLGVGVGGGGDLFEILSLHASRELGVLLVFLVLPMTRQTPTSTRTLQRQLVELVSDDLT